MQTLRNSADFILASQQLIITINLSDFYWYIYSDVHYSKKAAVFDIVSVSATPTLLMTPVPCNFFRVANSDYRVGVELGDKHHLSGYCFAFGICNPRSCSCEALFDTKSVFRRFSGSVPF